MWTWWMAPLCWTSSLMSRNLIFVPRQGLAGWRQISINCVPPGMTADLLPEFPGGPDMRTQSSAMRELVVLSGKGGTGKTSLVGALAALAPDKVLCDADVDAADLHLLLP